MALMIHLRTKPMKAVGVSSGPSATARRRVTGSCSTAAVATAFLQPVLGVGHFRLVGSTPNSSLPAPFSGQCRFLVPSKSHKLGLRSEPAARTNERQQQQQQQQRSPCWRLPFLLSVGLAVCPWGELINSCFRFSPSQPPVYRGAYSLYICEPLTCVGVYISRGDLFFSLTLSHSLSHRLHFAVTHSPAGREYSASQTVSVRLCLSLSCTLTCGMDRTLSGEAERQEAKLARVLIARATNAFLMECQQPSPLWRSNPFA